MKGTSPAATAAFEAQGAPRTLNAVALAQLMGRCRCPEEGG